MKAEPRPSGKREAFSKGAKPPSFAQPFSPPNPRANSAGVRYPRLLCGRSSLYSFRHAVISEQYSWIISGKVKVVFDDREIVVGPGEILLIPANVPHSAVAEEDTVDVDIFVPRREDWIRKEDAYLRK